MVAMFIILLGTYWDIILGSSFQLLFIIKDSLRKSSYKKGILENRDLRIKRTIELIYQNKPPATSQRMIKPQPMIITFVVSSWKQKIEAWIRSELKEDLSFWWVMKCVHPYFVKKSSQVTNTKSISFISFTHKNETNFDVSVYYLRQEKGLRHPLLQAMVFSIFYAVAGSCSPDSDIYYRYFEK